MRSGTLCHAERGLTRHHRRREPRDIANAVADNRSTRTRTMRRLAQPIGYSSTGVSVTESSVAPVATSNSPTCGRVKLPQLTRAGRGEATVLLTAWQYGPRLL